MNLTKQYLKLNQKTNSPKKITKEETYDDSSKNLANFFNGEIIALDESITLQYAEFFAKESFLGK